MQQQNEIVQEQEQMEMEIVGGAPAQQEQARKGSLRAFEWFAYMRAKQPVMYNKESDSWFVFRYEDVYQVVNDDGRFSSENIPTFADNFLRDTLIAQDPPNHRRLRNVVGQALSPRAMNNLKDDIERITQELLDAARPQGKLEFVSEFAFPLTSRVIGTLLGVPDEDMAHVSQWNKVFGGGIKAKTFEEIVQTRNHVGEDAYAYFAHLLAACRREPRPGLLAALDSTEVSGERMSDDELVKFCILLMAAGQSTVQSLLVNAMYCLKKYPEACEQVMQQPELMPSAIEEVLRYFPPFWLALRRTRKVVRLGNQNIPAGRVVQAWCASANHDEHQFPDPERFDIERKPNRHLTFGHGIHFCIGAPLARLEAQIAITTMLRQLKHIRGIPDQPGVISQGPIHTINSLPLMFEA